MRFKDCVNPRSGVRIGLVVLLANLAALAYLGYVHAHAFGGGGTLSQNAIEGFRQELLRTPATSEGVRGTADYVSRRLSADADLIDAYWMGLSVNLSINAIIGAYLLCVSVKLKRTQCHITRNESVAAQGHT